MLHEYKILLQYERLGHEAIKVYKGLLVGEITPTHR
jgi:hypothetical protein